MKKTSRPLPLRGAPLQYAPENELGVVFLFSQVARRLQFRIEKTRASYPDCIAYRHAGDHEKRVRIEFEFKSSSFRAHGHNPRLCDCIVCWHDDLRRVSKGIEVIELKQHFGTPFKVWIQAALKSQWNYLDSKNRLTWALSRRASTGDLLLMYRTHPSCQVTDVFKYTGDRLVERNSGWRHGKAYFGQIKRVCKLDSPLFLSDFRHHRVLRTAPFVTSNMQGHAGLLVSEYWPYLYFMISKRNPKIRKHLARFAPESLG